MFNKNHISIAVAIFFIAVSGCGKKNKAPKVKATESVRVSSTSTDGSHYVLDASNSLIEWEGFKPGGSHSGELSFETGEFKLADNKIVSGTFSIDMTSLEVTDIPKEDEDNARLMGHLKNDDFFAVVRFPTAVFEVTGTTVEEGKSFISGNLLIKDKAQHISFPFSLSEQGDVLTLKSETFSIDRTKWDIRYGSKSFFDNLGDRFIRDEMEIKINISAMKKPWFTDLLLKLLIFFL